MNNANQVCTGSSATDEPVNERSNRRVREACSCHSPTSFVHAARGVLRKAVRRMGESVNPDQVALYKPQRVSCTGRNSSLGREVIGPSSIGVKAIFRSNGTVSADRSAA